MEYDADKVMPADSTIDFFNEHVMEIIATCIRIQPNTDGVSDMQADLVRFEAMTLVAKKYEFGKYRHLCKTCHKDFATCGADPMFGKLETEDNVCFCENYTIFTDTEKQVLFNILTHIEKQVSFNNNKYLSCDEFEPSER